MAMNFRRKMPIPLEIKEAYPISSQIKTLKGKREKEITEILRGKSDKLLLIVGPCSADNEKSVLDYVSRLALVQEKVKEKLILVPRVYTNKPRTLCEGYMGMIFQPDPSKNNDILQGIISVRKLHLKVVSESGLTAADEMLYPEDFRYISDLLSYVVIGARSTENQLHRLTASGVDIPVGVKNPTSGDLNVMLNSLKAVQNGHTFLYRGWEVNSDGNPFAHAVLRGLINEYGEDVPNYHYENLHKLYKKYSNCCLNNMSVIIDTNHSNSGKNPLEQIRICKEIMDYRKYSEIIRKLVKGFMIESYIVDGKQEPTDNVYGKSVTDACLGWDKTERLILDIAEQT